MMFLGSRACDTLVAACVALMMTMTAGVAAWAAGPQPAPESQPQSQPQSTSHPQFGGRYPHLAVSNRQGECGIGAVVPWADRLWFITYAPHARHGSDDKLYELDGQLRLSSRPESVGGTPAARFIHDPTHQLVLGPYVIDAAATVHAVSPAEMEGRLTAAARHPTDPAGKVLMYDMEGLLYELDMRSHEPRLLFARASPAGTAKACMRGRASLSSPTMASIRQT
jgi:hypothetical protein